MGERNPDELGALWERKGARGKYMTGTIEIDGKVHEVVCFPVDVKKNDKQPDWRIKRSVPKAAAGEDENF